MGAENAVISIVMLAVAIVMLRLGRLRIAFGGRRAASGAASDRDLLWGLLRMRMAAAAKVVQRVAHEGDGTVNGKQQWGNATLHRAARVPKNGRMCWRQ